MLEMMRQLARLAPDQYKSVNQSVILKTDQSINEDINHLINKLISIQLQTLRLLALARLAPDHYKSVNPSRHFLKTNRSTNEETNRSTNFNQHTGIKVTRPKG
jgi:hypothetical protein